MSDKSTVTITGPGVYKTDAAGQIVRDDDGQAQFRSIGDEVDLPVSEARMVVETGQAVFKNKTEAKAAGAADRTSVTK